MELSPLIPLHHILKTGQMMSFLSKHSIPLIIVLVCSPVAWALCCLYLCIQRHRLSLSFLLLAFYGERYQHL